MIANLQSRLTPFFSFSNIAVVFFSVFIFFLSCQNNINNESDIESIPVEIKFDRFDLKFYGQSPEVIPQLKKDYPFLFPKQFSDSVWIKRQKDSLQLLLTSECRFSSL